MFRFAFLLGIVFCVLASDDEACDSKSDDLCLLQTRDKLALESVDPDYPDETAEVETETDQLIDDETMINLNPDEMDPELFAAELERNATSNVTQPQNGADISLSEDELELLKLPREDRPLPADLLNCLAAFNNSFISMYDWDPQDVTPQESDEGVTLYSFQLCLQQNHFKPSFAIKYPAFFKLFNREGGIAVWKWIDELQGSLAQFARSVFADPVSMFEIVEYLADTSPSIFHAVLQQPRAFWQFYTQFHIGQFDTSGSGIEKMAEVLDKIGSGIENPAFTIAETCTAHESACHIAVNMIAGTVGAEDGASSVGNFTEMLQEKLVASGKFNESDAAEFLQSRLEQLGLTTPDAIHDAYVHHTMQSLGFPKLIQDRMKKMPRMKPGDF